MITSKRSIIKRVRFIRFDIYDKKQNNIQYHCCTICPFTTLYLPAGNDCIYCIKSVIECPLLHSLEVFCCFAPGTGLFPATKSHLGVTGTCPRGPSGVPMMDFETLHLCPVFLCYINNSVFHYCLYISSHCILMWSLIEECQGLSSRLILL